MRSKLVRGAVLAVALTACSAAEAGETVVVSEPPTTTVPEIVMPNPDLPPYSATVTFTFDNLDPEILFIPAGQVVRLGIRNRTYDEHHYRVVGLVAADIRWQRAPENTVEELEAMSPEEQEAAGFDPEKSDAEHEVHHSATGFTPTKPVSPAGIKPLGTEVHGYATGGEADLIEFIPLTPGRFEVEDVMNPGVVIGTVVVYVVPDE